MRDLNWGETQEISAGSNVMCYGIGVTLAMGAGLMGAIVRDQFESPGIGFSVAAGGAFLSSVPFIVLPKHDLTTILGYFVNFGAAIALFSIDFSGENSG